MNHRDTEYDEEAGEALVYVHAAICNDDPHQLVTACSADVDLDAQFTASINPQHEKMTPLALACALNKIDLAGILVDHGASVDAPFASLQTTALMTSAFHGNNDAVSFLLSYGADVSVVDKQQSTALGYAFGGTRNPEVIEALLAAGVDVNRKNILGMNALLLVAGYGDDSLVRVVLDAGADATATNDFGHTALHLAVVGKKDQLGRLKRLGSADAAAADRSLNRRNLDLAMREWARLHRDTAGSGSEEALSKVGSFMMSIGQNLEEDDAADGDDQAAMMRRVEAVWKYRQEKLREAKESRKPSVVSTLLSCGGGRSRSAVDATARPGAQPFPAAADLPRAARADLSDDTADEVAQLVERCARIVRMLVDAGCRSEQTERTFGMTPLDMAIVNGDIESAAVLVSVSGADPEHLLKMFALSDLHEALRLSRRARLRELLAYDDDIDVNASFSRFNVCRNADERPDAPDEGVTPLIVAVRVNDVDAVKLLLKHGAAVNKLSSAGYTALGEAAAMGHRRVADVLLQNKAAIEQSVPAYEQATPVVIAVIMKKHLMVDFLVKKNAKVDQPLADGSTSLLKAFNARDIEMVHHLMVADINNNFINKDGLMYKQALAYQNNTVRDVQAILQEVSEAAKELVSESEDDFDDDPDDDSPEKTAPSPINQPVMRSGRPAPPKSAPPAMAPLDLDAGYSDDELPESVVQGTRTSTFTEEPPSPVAIQQPTRPAPTYVKPTAMTTTTTTQAAAKPTTTATFVKPPTTPTLSKVPSPSYEKPASPVYEKPPTPTYAKPPTQTYAKPAAPVYAKPAAPSYAKPATPNYVKPATPSFAKPPTVTFAKPPTASTGGKPPRPPLTPSQPNGGTLPSPAGTPPVVQKGIVEKQTAPRQQFVTFAEPENTSPASSPRPVHPVQPTRSAPPVPPVPEIPLPDAPPPPIPDTPLPDETPDVTPVASPVKTAPVNAVPERPVIYANVSASCTPNESAPLPVPVAVETTATHSGKETTL